MWILPSLSFNSLPFVPSLFHILHSVLSLLVPSSLSVPSPPLWLSNSTAYISNCQQRDRPEWVHAVCYLFQNSTKYCWTSVYTCQVPSIPLLHLKWAVKDKSMLEVSEIHESNSPKPVIDLYGRAKCCSLPTLPSCFQTQYRVNFCELAFLTHTGICKLKINTKATFQKKMLIHVPSWIGERTHCL